MGSGQSAPSFEAREQVSVDSVAHEESSVKDGSPKEEVGTCPMKNADGSYSYAWGALFNSSPHGRSGSKNLSSENPERIISTNPEAKVKVDGCPSKLKHIEYNVYGQPVINTSNNMPHNPNQLPSHTQLLPLSTERIASTIPKVRLFCERCSIASIKFVLAGR